MSSTDKIHRVRFLVAVTAITLCFGGLVWRLYCIQILEHEEYLDSALAMRRSAESVTAYRGTIHLRDHVIVARDVLDYEVGLDPRFIASEKIQELVRLICDAVGKPPEYRRERLKIAIEKKEKGVGYVHLLSGVSESLVKEIQGAVDRICSREERRGFRAQPRPRRTYPRDTLCSSVIGVTDLDGEGVEGIERSLQSYLSRRDGMREVVRDARQKTRIYRIGNTEVAPVGGYDVYLTLDSRTQAIVEEELEKGILEAHAEAGLFIVMDCNSGDILAMASYPTYDPNHFSEYPDGERKKRRTNRAVENLYEPGSVIKPFLAARILDRGICRRETLIRDMVTGPVTWDGGKQARFGRRPVSDVHAYPDLNVEGAVVHSSNISMAILGLRVGRAGIVDMLTKFGLCSETGIDLPFEGKGKYPTEKEWNPVYSPVSIAFGYEVMLSPLQLCRAFAAVINGGYLLKPRIVEKVVRDGEEQVFPTRQIEGRPISAETSQTMREILHLVVEEGTGKYLKTNGFEFGGKTGTADMARGGYKKSDYLASFEAFAPFEKPQVVALCMIEKPRKGSYYGAMVAGPVVADVLRRMFQVKEETKLALIKKRATN